MPSEETPRRRRGGQELPDKVQNRPEQNEGYDEAVQDPTGAPDTASDMEVDDLAGDGDRMVHIQESLDDAASNTGKRRPRSNR